MSPDSRERRSHLRVVPDLPAGPVLRGSALLKFTDPLNVEKAAAEFLDAAEPSELLVDELMPKLEKRASRPSLAALLTIGSLADDTLGKAAAEAAEHLITAGVPQPRWAAELRLPVTSADGWRLFYPDGSTSALSCTFHRGERSHALVMMVDNLAGDVATDLLLMGIDELADAIDKLADLGRRNGIEVSLDTPDKFTVRRDMERAVRVRADRDRAGTRCRVLGADLPHQEGPGYHAMLWLFRTRMATIEDEISTSLLPGGARSSPIYRLKVSLHRSKPPLWRRLEVPAAISLRTLHTIIQAAFGRQEDHLHSFVTRYGKVDRHTDKSVSLAHIAPKETGEFQYSCWTTGFTTSSWKRSWAGTRRRPTPAAPLVATRPARRSTPAKSRRHYPACRSGGSGRGRHPSKPPAPGSHAAPCMISRRCGQCDQNAPV